MSSETAKTLLAASRNLLESSKNFFQTSKNMFETATKVIESTIALLEKVEQTTSPSNEIDLQPNSSDAGKDSTKL